MSVTAAKPPHVQEQPQGAQANRVGKQGAVHQPGCGAAVCVAVCTVVFTGKASGQAAVPPPGYSRSGHHPSRRYSNYGFHLSESCCQKERGDPDGGPTQTHSCPGLWLQGVPEPGAWTGGQQRQLLCSVQPGKWPAQPGGRAERRSEEVKEHPGAWAQDQLVEPLPALPEAKVAGGGSTRSRGPPMLSPPSRKRGRKRQGGMEMGPCSGRQVNPLLASLTCPTALQQQIQGSGMWGTAKWGCAWRSIQGVA